METSNQDREPSLGNERLAHEATRLYERYAVEVVERYDLCPWASRARRGGEVRTEVLLQQDPADLNATLDRITELAKSESVTIGILLYPRLHLGRLDFEHFLRRLRHADTARHELGCVPFAMAAFHPEAQPDLTDADRLIPFIRRTPDPTIQLVRRTALDAVRAQPDQGTAFAHLGMLSSVGQQPPATADVRARIALRNLETLRRVGAPELDAVFADIARDRAESYARSDAP